MVCAWVWFWGGVVLWVCLFVNMVWCCLNLLFVSGSVCGS